ncbi:beta-glucanase-like [Bradysia coprophila]|uniref:beta-glucanase-like n=1 Tax=Bradysia coprophila TaxID=38358 RepID=UPI00187D6EAD|nr:beta-glucanase-like [Bradysia coprophila]
MITAVIFVLLISIHVHADTLLWSDEFDGPAGQVPDSTKWKYDTGGGGWGNQELEYYTESNMNAALDGNGNLVITARQENNNNYECWYGRCQYTSARLLTAGKFSQKYGAIEARIKIPKGQGLWPAFWMLGDDIFQVGWPQCGEIDILENIGREPLAIHGTLHGPGYSAADGLTSTYRLPNNQPFADDFHVYRADWTSNSISFSVDGHQYVTKSPSDTPPGKKWVFDHNFFIILNVAVGGGWPGPPNSKTVFPQSMIIDYVNVYSTDTGNDETRGIAHRCDDVLGTGRENLTLVQLNDCDRSFL